MSAPGQSTRVCDEHFWHIELLIPVQGGEGDEEEQMQHKYAQI